VTDCLVIAVDGPAGSGKSSAARGAASKLGLRYLDTGAMYRALTWWMISQGVDISDQQAVAEHAARPDIEAGTDPGSPEISVNGKDVAGHIRTREVSNAVSAVASVPEVRARLVGQQQRIVAEACAAGQGIVAEGRDIGTVVAPDATVKVFLTASEDTRARRRSADLTADPAATAEVTRHEQTRRDRADAPQTAVADDARRIDSTALSLDQVISEIVALAPGRGGSAGQQPGPRSQAGAVRTGR
jgi:cytidylate kinase